MNYSVGVMDMTNVIRTYLVVRDPETGRFTCPECGKPDRGTTKTDKIWDHVVPEKPATTSTMIKVIKSAVAPKACAANGATVITEPLSGSALVASAKALGSAVHAKDIDKSGEPYVGHLQGVADGVVVLAGFHPEAIATAWLHDTVEDHPSWVSFDKLVKWGYPPAVVAAVAAVTKQTSEEQGLYLERVKTASSPYRTKNLTLTEEEADLAAQTSSLTKLADLLHNTRFDRLADVAKVKGEATRVRLLKKYTPAKAALMLHLGIIQTPEGQELATKPVGSATGTGSWSGGSSVVAADGSQSFKGSSLIAGDWVAGWPAPVKHKVKGHDNRYVLTDETARRTDKTRSYKVWTKASWQAKQKKETSWSPEQEKQPDPKAPVTTTKTTAPKQTAGPSTAPKTGQGTFKTAKESNAVTQPGTAVVAGNASTKGEVAVRNITSATPTPPGKWPAQAQGAPRSVCGECGKDTFQVSSYYWKHADNIFTHVASKPTKSRVEKLVALGLVTVESDPEPQETK